MYNEASIQAVNQSSLNERFGKPLYESYCFSQIPPTILHLLTGEGPAGLPADVLHGLPRRYRKVILLFVDAFGWTFFERHVDQYPFLKRFVTDGVVSKLTTQFPSTTAAHVTTIHTGMPPGESGVYEWFYYEPKLDRVIAPLLFSFAGDNDRDTLAATGINPAEIYPQRTIHQQLVARGVGSYIYQYRDYTPSPYSDAIFTGATVRPYRTIAEALVNMADAVIDEPGPAYFFLYFSGIDTLGHIYGPDTRQFNAEIDMFMTTLERLLHGTLAGNTSDTLLLVTADHGQMAVTPEETIYLNRLPESIEPFIKRNRQGQLIVPGGSPRDMFLYIQDEHLDAAQDMLVHQLAGRAEVYRTQDLIEQGFFGACEPSATFLSRVGNLVILAYEGEGVWWFDKGRFEQRLKGHHGGLSRAEMETILLALPYA